MNRSLSGSALDPSAPANPFSSRHVRPGAVPFLFPDGTTAASLIERLRVAGWRGQIVGPHGSGKSALVAALVPAVEESGRRAVLFELHDGQRRMPEQFPPPDAVEGQCVVIVDGYEQLSPWNRFRLRRTCESLGLGLVATAHRPVGFPDLFRLAPDVSVAQRIVGWLVRNGRVAVAPEEVAASYAAHQGDLREMLFDLYDLYERRLREGA